MCVSVLPHEGNATESNEQDPEREFSGVRHLLVSFLALVLGFGTRGTRYQFCNLP
jgi:hypothetical protein